MAQIEQLIKGQRLCAAGWVYAQTLDCGVLNDAFEIITQGFTALRKRVLDQSSQVHTRALWSELFGSRGESYDC